MDRRMDTGMENLYAELLVDVPQWCVPEGETADLVISSRARLARNLTTLPFVHRSIKNERFRVIEQVENAVQRGENVARSVYLSLLDTSELDRGVLVERRLISPSLAEGTRPAGVFIGPGESFSLMVNEEDHLRLQAIKGGLQVRAAWQEADKIDTELSKTLDFAFSDEFGYLTSCPSNTGTGMRLSVLMHLPGLTLADQMASLGCAMEEIGFTVRGLHGEGTGRSGNMYQVSNQCTLGHAEEEIVDRLDRVTRRLAAFEERACDALATRAKRRTEDRVARAYGLLKHARLLGEMEALDALSMLRMGAYMELCQGMETSAFNQLMIAIQPAHIRMASGREMSAEERDERRAELVREHLRF